MVSTDLSAAQLSPSEHQAQLRRAVIASTVGTAIEWYDFFLHSTVTGLVFAKLFFPHSGGPAPLIAAALFAHYHTPDTRLPVTSWSARSSASRRYPC
jgi:hypothetical protein